MHTLHLCTNLLCQQLIVATFVIVKPSSRSDAVVEYLCGAGDEIVQLCAYKVED